MKSRKRQIAELKTQLAKHQRFLGLLTKARRLMDAERDARREAERADIQYMLTIDGIPMRAKLYVVRQDDGMMRQQLGEMSARTPIEASVFDADTAQTLRDRLNAAGVPSQVMVEDYADVFERYLAAFGAKANAIAGELRTLGG